jgi:hypothetical protein
LEPALSIVSGAIVAAVDSAVYTASAAIAAAVLSAAVAVRATREARRLAERNRELDRQAKLFDRDLSAEDLLKKYSEPLAAAAFDLQSRCWNIVCNDFFGKFGRHHERFRDAQMTTLFRLAQYFGWAEILRSEIQYLSFPNKDDDTKNVSKHLAQVANRVATSKHDEPLMIWADEQRAIGERMIIEHPKGARCMGYASFCDKYAECFEPLFARVFDDLDDEAAKTRLRDVQHELCKLVRALDPNRLRYQDSDIQPGVYPLPEP